MVIKIVYRLVVRLSVLFLSIVWAVQVQAYSGGLDYLICDIKRPLAGVTKKKITEENMKMILDALRYKLKCNGIRVYIDPRLTDKSEYPEIYHKVLKYAKHNLGMIIYANPLGTGDFGKSDMEYVDWIANYVLQFFPDFVGFFNEPGMPNDRLIRISEMIRKRLPDAIKVVGPDVQKVKATIRRLNNDSKLNELFDIIGSHNADKDDQATARNWHALATLTNRPIWASENPRPWSAKNSKGEEIGVRAIFLSSKPISGLVIYMSFPWLVDEKGELTYKGKEIADNIGEYEVPIGNEN